MQRWIKIFPSKGFLILTFTFFSQGYTKALDIWSVGCILGEMINNKPMFPGKHYLDQICKIQEVLGSPGKDDLSFITNPKAQLYVSSLPHRPTVAWKKVYPNANERQLNILDKLLGKRFNQYNLGLFFKFFFISSI